MIRDFLAFWGRPQILRAVHGFLTVFWLVLWLAAWAFGWLTSVTFVSHLSAAALVLGSLSSWQAARVEVGQQRERRQDEG